MESEAGLPVEAAQQGSEEPLTALHPNHTKVLRIAMLLSFTPFLAGSLVLESAQLLPPGAIAGSIWLVVAWLIMVLPWRRYQACGYRMGPDRLQIVRGLLFRKDTIVPFGRVQHIDVAKGPVERYFGLATLTLHTAGTHNASVSLPGLAEPDALSIR